MLQQSRNSYKAWGEVSSVTNRGQKRPGKAWLTCTYTFISSTFSPPTLPAAHFNHAEVCWETSLNSSACTAPNKCVIPLSVWERQWVTVSTFPIMHVVFLCFPVVFHASCISAGGRRHASKWQSNQNTCPCKTPPLITRLSIGRPLCCAKGFICARGFVTVACRERERLWARTGPYSERSQV